MSMPFYVSPEQVMKDRADYARKGIARGRSLVALEFSGGIVIVAENPSRTLFKISEVYDRIAFAGVGKYNEFQMLKIGGVRLADMKGFQYSREDVTANSLANAYAQTLGQVFTHEMKPYEVEILVAEVGVTDEDPNQLFHILYDGTLMDESDFTVLGGDAERISEALDGAFTAGLDLSGAVRLGAQVLAEDGDRLSSESLEVAVLERGRPRRAFRRIRGAELDDLLG
ncbi:MAG: hypothetical protein RL531_479 [Actinomycetota bacterium]|jgi:proteasome alpha subunit